MKNCFIIVFFLGVAVLCNAQNSFEFFIESDEDEVINSAIEDNNGNYILVGGVGDRIIWKFDALAIKVTSDGNYVSRCFGMGDTVSLLTEIILLDDGNYMAFGAYSPIGDFDARNHFWIIKLDPQLNTIFEKTFIVNSFYHLCGAGYSIIDDSGNIIIAGEAYYYDPPNPTAFSDIMMVRLNQEGDTLLTRYYLDQFTEFVYDLSQIPGNNDYLLLGGLFGLGGQTVQYFRLDNGFNIISLKNFPGMTNGGVNFLNHGSSDHWLSDSSFLYSSSFLFPDKIEKNEIAFGVFNVDTNANVLQHLYFDRPDTVDYAAWINSMAYANDTTVYIGGFQSVLDPWLNMPTILELYVVDKELNLLGYKDYGADANNQLLGILPTSDGGCLMYGTRFDNPEGIHERDIRIIKLLREDIELEISPITATEETLQQVGRRAYPNPVLQTINIPLGEYTGKKDNRITLFTISGKKILDRKLRGMGNVMQVDVGSLAPGIYLYQISGTGVKPLIGKFLKK